MSRLYYRLVILGANNTYWFMQKDSGEQRVPHELKPLLQALNTLPVCTSCTAECERGFSQTNLITSATRNCMLVTTVSCLLFAKLVGPPFAKFVSLNYMKSGWFKDAIQLMTLTVCVLQLR